MDKETTTTDVILASYLSDKAVKYGITQKHIQKALGGRSQGYVSERISGKRSWSISELDRIAPLFHAPNALALIAGALSESLETRQAEQKRVHDAVNTKINQGMLGLAASHDPDKEVSGGVDEEFV
ncbi:MAG: hypothetical protein SOI13_01290 [Bifidobacterium mongoliense]|jgi:hypothetical protein|uniref:hypothetical protein n=1 Tax=Bifidobacterium mongoliense TaxID=518643 RepID=UPI002F3605C8